MLGALDLDAHPYFAIYLLGSLLVVLLFPVYMVLYWTIAGLTGARVYAKNIKKLQRSAEEKPLLSRAGKFLWMSALDLALSWISAAILAWRILSMLGRAVRVAFASTPEIVRELRFPLNTNPDLPRESVWAYVVALGIKGGGIAPPDPVHLQVELDQLCAELPTFDRRTALRQLESLKVVAPEVIAAANARQEDEEEHPDE